MTLPRLMLAGDHTLVLTAFSKLLESRYDVVGTGCDGRTLLESAPSLRRGGLAR
jgi:hypothetical protein